VSGPGASPPRPEAEVGAELFTFAARLSNDLKMWGNVDSALSTLTPDERRHVALWCSEIIDWCGHVREVAQQGLDGGGA
jgi:hypothetical protein